MQLLVSWITATAADIEMIFSVLERRLFSLLLCTPLLATFIRFIPAIIQQQTKNCPSLHNDNHYLLRQASLQPHSTRQRRLYSIHPGLRLAVTLRSQARTFLLVSAPARWQVLLSVSAHT